jgi:translation initiation factor IF-3
MLGVMHPLEALRIAEEKGLDLVEIVPNSDPPTCKIMDFGKWKYENKKKQVAARKNQIIVAVKELQIRPRTDQHDLDTKLRHARKFLLEGDKVKFNLRFSGREMVHQELGFELLQKVMGSLSDIGLVEVSPKLEGKQLFAIIAPDAAKIKALKQASHSEAQPSTARSAEND